MDINRVEGDGQCLGDGGEVKHIHARAIDHGVIHAPTIGEEVGVIPAAPFEGVGAGSAGDDVGDVIAAQDIGVIATGDVLEIGHPACARRCSGNEVHIDAGGVGTVVQQIRARTGIDETCDPAAIGENKAIGGRSAGEVLHIGEGEGEGTGGVVVIGRIDLPIRSRIHADQCIRCAGAADKGIHLAEAAGDARPCAAEAFGASAGEGHTYRTRSSAIIQAVTGGSTDQVFDQRESQIPTAAEILIHGIANLPGADGVQPGQAVHPAPADEDVHVFKERAQGGQIEAIHRAQIGHIDGLCNAQTGEVEGVVARCARQDIHVAEATQSRTDTVDAAHPSPADRQGHRAAIAAVIQLIAPGAAVERAGECGAGVDDERIVIAATNEVLEIGHGERLTATGIEVRPAMDLPVSGSRHAGQLVAEEGTGEDLIHVIEVENAIHPLEPVQRAECGQHDVDDPGGGAVVQEIVPGRSNHVFNIDAGVGGEIGSIRHLDRIAINGDGDRSCDP